MKKTILQVSFFCLAFIATSRIAMAQTEIIGPDVPLSNAGFESPALGKETNFTLAYPWQDTGINYTNSGIQPDAAARSGAYDAYEDTVDDGAYQIDSYVGYQITNGDMITLSWWAEGSYNGTNTTFTGTGPTDPIQQVSLLKAVSQSDAFTSTTALAGQTNGLPGTQAGWVQYTVNYTATPADAGNYLGVSFFTTTADGKIPNSFALYDDFSLYVLPAGSKPVIVSPPASQTAYTGATVTFNVSAINATSYQWMEGAPGSGIYTNLSDSGQFSGVTTSSLTITNVTPTNNADIVVVVSNGNGSVTSAPPANLTVATIIYQETFDLPVASQVNDVGWRDDVKYNSDNRIYGGAGNPVVSTNRAVYSYTPNPGNEVFWTTAAVEDGSISNQMAFPGINLATVANLTFGVQLQSGFDPNTVVSYFVVQMNGGSWYVSTNNPLPGNGPVVTSTWGPTYTVTFNPASANWNQITVSPNGSVDVTTNNGYGVIGAPASADLTGYITGVGIMCSHDGNGTHDFDNFTVAGAIPPTASPVINSPPFSQTNYTGTAATFSVAATTNGSTAGLTYQWMNGTVGSGIYADLSNGGQFSGVTNSTLVISNVTSAANQKDYVVVVTDGAGSVTSTPPATLTVVDSAPLLVNGALVYPNSASAFTSSAYSIHAGNNNTLNFTASFVGNLPMTLQWQFSTDQVSVVNIPNAINSLYTLSNPQTNNSGYYRLSASNSQGGPSNSVWAQLTVAPASTALFHWSAPVVMNGLTAAQILGSPTGTYFEAETFGAPLTMVTNGVAIYTFDNTGASASLTGGLGGMNQYSYYPGLTGLTTGDAGLDAVFSDGNFDGGTHYITIHNLTPGAIYSVQIFGLDLTAGGGRAANYSDTNDVTDVSATTFMPDNAYTIGTFTATNADVAFQQNLLNTHGVINAIVVRTVPPPLSIQALSSSSMQVVYMGTLLQSTNVNGPWTTNSTASPYMFTPTGPGMFFKAVAP